MLRCVRLRAETTGGPRFFGPDDDPLFAWYHAPARAPLAPPVVICPPFGYENVCAAKTLRHLGERLAVAGVPALRIAYHGTGDSAGDDGDPGRVAAWLASVAAAIDEARRLAGAETVQLVGLRLGATLAATVAAGRADVAAVALWAPILSGRHYGRELKALRMLGEQEVHTPPDATPRAPGEEEAAGFRLTAETLAGLATLDLGKLARPPAPRVLVVRRDDVSGGEERLVERLAGLGATVDDRAGRGYVAMLQDPHKTVVPDALLDELVAWLGGGEPGVVAAVGPGPAARVRARAGAAPVRESLHLLGPSAARMFAVMSEPDGGAAHGPLVILLNAGAVSRVGPNRLYVRWARAWAARGRRVLRLDLTGLGDSQAKPGRRETELYAAHLVEDVRAAVAALGARDVVLAGLCSGAYVAYHAALVEPAVRGLLLMNPQTFFFKEGDSLDVKGRQTFKDAQHYQRRFFELAAWKKVLAGEVDARRVARVAVARARDLAEARVKDALGFVGIGDAETMSLRRGFGALLDRGVRVLMVYCGDDPGLDYIRTRLGRHVDRLRRTPGFDMAIVDGPDHTFTPLWAQELLTTLLDSRAFP